MKKKLSFKKVKEKVKIKEFIPEGKKNCVTFKTEINPWDFNQLALVLKDLELHGYPIEKAIKRFRSIKKKGDFPLW